MLEMQTGVMPFSSLSNDFAVIRSVTRDGAPPIPADANLSQVEMLKSQLPSRLTIHQTIDDSLL